MYTNEETLAEARRRLFFSRCRFAYLVACRARLACLFGEETVLKSKPPNSLHAKLTNVGFEVVREICETGAGVETIPADFSALKRFASSQLFRSVPVLTPAGLPEELIKENLGKYRRSGVKTPLT